MDELAEYTGLSGAEVADRFSRYGLNEIDSSKNRGSLHLFFEVLKEPMFFLLLICGGVYFVLGDVGEALMLLGFVVLVIGITLYQENKTERALDALRGLSSPRALVIREGKQQRIAGREVVVDDILVLTEGDRVPADAIVLSCRNLCIDESILTGESAPVRKAPGKEGLEIGLPGGDDLPFVYSGTLIVSGTGIARVKSTGMRTEMGKIGKSLGKIISEKTPLQTEIDSLVKRLAIGGVFLCIIVILIYGITRQDWIHGILIGVTLAMSILPEEFPVIITVFLALGAWRMSKNMVLARKQQAIQALGSTTVLCVDKTGTLTLNKMVVKNLSVAGKKIEVTPDSSLPEAYHELIEYGILASQKEPFDPMEISLRDLCTRKLSDSEHIHGDWEFVQEYPLTKQLLSISHVWMAKGRTDYVVAAKGAPEAIGDLCHLGQQQATQLTDDVIKMANLGLRVIGVAKATSKMTSLPAQQHSFDFSFIGLIGFEDPLRPNVRQSVEECHDAGVRVIMITGDYPGTAAKIAKEAGLKDVTHIITGPELASMSDTELKSRISGVNIFARVVPEQKLRIVNALKENGEIMAMTGDGVNDAPALKSAHIGIAMGARGTDVAREASAIVILDDDFTSIVRGIRMGRRIFDNIKKAMRFALAVHIPIAGLTLLSVVAMWPLILLPAHIAFLQLIIDPACSIVFEAEPEEKNIMKRKPRNPKDRMFSKKMVFQSLLQGMFVLLAVAIIFKGSMFFNHTEGQARALSFTSLVIASLCLILTNVSKTESAIQSLKIKNTALYVVVVGSLVLLTCLLTIPLLRDLFMFEPIGAIDVLAALTFGIASVVWFEILKLSRHKDQ